MRNFSTVWIFQGNNATFPSATFSTKEQAIMWIENNALSGILTQYPVDISVYDWAIINALFTPNSDHKKTAEFKAKYTSSYLLHHHFIEGELVA